MKILTKHISHKEFLYQALVAHTCNSSCLGGCNREDHGSSQPGQIVHVTPIFKITRAKWTGGVAQVVQRLLCKSEVLSSNSVPQKKEIYFPTTQKTNNPLNDVYAKLLSRNIIGT
jgi:hypothetical protein